MRNTLTIMQRELRSYFASALAYSVMAVFLGLSGFFFCLSIQRPGQATQQVLYNASSILLFITPLITMRLVAEERRTGTIELLMTAPVTETQMILGKYLGSVAFFAVMIGLTVEYPIILMRVGHPDKGPILAGYLGLLLLGSSFLAVGTLISTLTKSQIVAAVGGFAAMLMLGIVTAVSQAMGASGTTTAWSEAVRYLSLFEHFENFVNGLIDSRDLIFFASMIGFCLFLSIRTIASVKSR